MRRKEVPRARRRAGAPTNERGKNKLGLGGVLGGSSRFDEIALIASGMVTTDSLKSYKDGREVFSNRQTVRDKSADEGKFHGNFELCRDIGSFGGFEVVSKTKARNGILES
mmetsp:Transcript_20351/g.23380  ORF Transcript_20351/g.23380 Transcript_20351/m.23380 type:complete len:111 (+) Transcript_20351:924-1256(+)